MNRRRIKLAALSASMILSLGLMVSGVYAATTQGGTITNNVSFTAINVNATVTYTVEGDSDTTNDTAVTWATFAAADAQTTFAAIPDLAFPSDAAVGATIKIEITITNNDTANLLYFAFTKGTLASATNIELNESYTTDATSKTARRFTSPTNIGGPIQICYKLTSNTANASASLSGYDLTLTNS